jgi:hypothetical protein
MAAINVGEICICLSHYCIPNPSYIPCIISEFVRSKCTSRALICNSSTREGLHVQTVAAHASYQTLTLSSLYGISLIISDYPI